MTGLSYASLAVTVGSCARAVPAVPVVDGVVVTTSWVADPALTVMFELAVDTPPSVAVMVCVPAVCNVAPLANVFVPLSPPTKV